MALVKKSKISRGTAKLVPPPARSAPVPASNRHANASERIAAATEQLASGLSQAAAATKQLGRSMEQIASGAEEAAGASQEQSSAIKAIVASLTVARLARPREIPRSRFPVGSVERTRKEITRRETAKRTPIFGQREHFVFAAENA